MAVAVLAVFFRSETIFLLLRFLESGITSYSGWKLFCTSTPRPFEGRSLICPIEAITMKSLPRYLLIVFALAGDSTITRFFVIPSQIRSRTDDTSMLVGCFPGKWKRVWGALENNTKSPVNPKQALPAA